MSTFRDNMMKGPSRLLLPLLVAFFLVSLSFHNHALNLDSTPVIEISGAEPDIFHSIEDCYACLQGNSELPHTEAKLSAPFPVNIKTLEENDFLIPSSFLKLNKPSRSPPAA